MDKSWMKLRNKFSIEFKEGVSQFLEVAKNHIDQYKRIRYPCKRCMNSNWDSLEGAERYLLVIEVSPSYTNWVYNGEPVNL